MTRWQSLRGENSAPQRAESGEREGGGAAGAVVVEADGGGLDEAADRGGGTGFLEDCGVSP